MDYRSWTSTVVVFVHLPHQRHTMIITKPLLYHIISPLPLSSFPPATARRTSSTTTSIPTPTKSKAANPPSQRISHSINRTLRTPQTNLTLAIRNIEQLDRSACPQTVTAAVVLCVLREDEAPQHGHVPAEGEGGPCEGLEADRWGWICI